MSNPALQRDLECIILRKNLEQALKKVVKYEEFARAQLWGGSWGVQAELNRENEEEEFESESESESEEENAELEEEDKDIEPLYNIAQVLKGYLLGILVGFSFNIIHPYINGRSKNNKR